MLWIVRFGLNEGFDFYDSPFDLRHQEGKGPGDIKRLGGGVVAAARQWLAENSNQRFFIFLHLFDLHTPYTLPPSYRSLPGLSGYDAALRYVDDSLGSLWKFLRERGLFDKVLLVFTADHGEGLGNHGESGHGYFIYESTTRVPLIVRWPAGTASFPARIGTPVSLIDVAPTVLQFLSIPLPAQFQGRSMLRLLKSEPSGTLEEVYSETVYGRRHFGVSDLRSIRAGNYKYIDAPKPELYNLTVDPGESKNLYERNMPLALTLRQSLLSFRARFKNQRPSEAAKAVSPEIMARLRSLGYAASGATRTEDTTSAPDPKDRIREFELYGRALMLSSLGRITQANIVLEKLLAKFPGLIDVSVCLGVNKQRQGRHAEAAELFKRALEEDPLNAAAHYDLGLSYYAMHKLDDASRELKATLTIAPHYSRARELLGTISMDRRDYSDARAHFTEMLKFSADDYAAHLRLGMVATLQARWDEAEFHLKSALKADPESSEAHNTLGSVYLYKGHMDQAANEFADAIRLNPKVASAYYNLGLVREKQGRKGEAATHFKAALSADPKFQPAQEALSRLGRH